MDVRIKTFQEATDTFAYLARLDLAELRQKLGDERLVDQGIKPLLSMMKWLCLKLSRPILGLQGTAGKMEID
jgi:hypothetical protein